MGAGGSSNRTPPPTAGRRRADAKPIRQLWSSVTRTEASDPKTVEKLLRMKMSLDHERARDGLTPLVVAAHDGYPKVVEALVKGKASVNVVCNRADGVCALHAAAQQGHVSIVRMLIEAKAWLDNRLDSDGSSALVAAAHGGHLSTVHSLLGADAPIELEMLDGATALYVACEAGHTFVVDALLSAKAAVDAPLLTNNSMPMNIAAQNGHVDIVNALLAHQARTDTTASSMGPWDNASPLLAASQAGHTSVVKALLAAKAHPDEPVSEPGFTPLMAAALFDHADIVDVLLSNKADPHHPRATTVGDVRALRQCPQGHVLVQHAVRDEKDQLCGICAASPLEMGSDVYSCSPCLYVACADCESKVMQSCNSKPIVIAAGSRVADIARACGNSVVTKVLNATSAKERRNSWKRKSPSTSPRGSFSNSTTPRHVAIGMNENKETAELSASPGGGGLDLGVRRRSWSRIVVTPSAPAHGAAIDDGVQETMDCSIQSTPDSSNSSGPGTPDLSHASTETELLTFAHSPKSKSRRVGGNNNSNSNSNSSSSSKSEPALGDSGMSPSPGVGTKVGPSGNVNGVALPANRVRLMS